MLSVKSINLSYKENEKVLDNVSLSFGQGVTALLGPNGSGKSTLLRLLASVLKPDSGHIAYRSRDIYQSLRHYRRKVGYLPQYFGGYDHLTCEGFLSYMCALKLIRPDIVSERVSRVLALFNLEELRTTRVSTLSRGNLQRVGLAQAMLNDPEIIIMDEPTVSLDTSEHLELLNLCRLLGRNRMIIFSTHLASDAETSADRVIVLRGGRVLEDCSPYLLQRKATGTVWDIPASSKENVSSDADIIGATALLRTTPPDPSGYLFRVLHRGRPACKAVQVEPSLEESYLSLLKGLF